MKSDHAINVSQAASADSQNIDGARNEPQQDDAAEAGYAEQSNGETAGYTEQVEASIPGLQNISVQDFMEVNDDQDSSTESTVVVEDVDPENEATNGSQETQTANRDPVPHRSLSDILNQMTRSMDNQRIQRQRLTSPYIEAQKNPKVAALFAQAGVTAQENPATVAVTAELNIGTVGNLRNLMGLF